MMKGGRCGGRCGGSAELINPWQVVAGGRFRANCTFVHFGWNILYIFLVFYLQTSWENTEAGNADSSLCSQTKSLRRQRRIVGVEQIRGINATQAKL